MYRDLLSTKSRKYSQRQRKLKWCEQKAYVTVQHRVLPMLAILFMVYMNYHMKPSGVFLYMTDTTEKSQGSVSLPLTTWISPIISSANTKMPRIVLHAGISANNTVLQRRMVDGKRLSSPFQYRLAWIQRCLPTAESRSPPHSLMPWFLASVGSFVPPDSKEIPSLRPQAHLHSAKLIQTPIPETTTECVWRTSWHSQVWRWRCSQHPQDSWTVRTMPGIREQKQ